MSLLLLPLWIMSGAMFPAPASGVLAVVQRANPMSYAVGAVRRALYGGDLPLGTGLAGGAAVELAVLFAFAALATAGALFVCHRQR
jgi:ABC-type polysaccharide/polyol phosphate export permease